MYSVRPAAGSASLAARLWLSQCLIFPLVLAILFSFFFLPSWAFYGLLLIFLALVTFSVRWMYDLFLLLKLEERGSMEEADEERRSGDRYRSTK